MNWYRGFFRLTILISLIVGAFVGAMVYTSYDPNAGVPFLEIEHQARLKGYTFPPKEKLFLMQSEPFHPNMMPGIRLIHPVNTKPGTKKVVQWWEFDDVSDAGVKHVFDAVMASELEISTQRRNWTALAAILASTIPWALFFIAAWLVRGFRPISASA